MAIDYSVPVIDVSSYIAGNASAEALLIPEIRRALENIGFLVITGHGIDDHLRQRALNVSKSFFDLPDQEKLKCHDVPGTFLGYYPLGAERVAYSHGIKTAPDLKASFTIGQPNVDESDPYYSGPEGLRMFQPSVWPARPSEMREVLIEYFHAAENLATHLMRLFATALQLPSDYFDHKLDRASNFLRVLDYPAIETEPEENQYRIGPHSDYGTLTLVAADGPGLQVRTSAGTWENVPYAPDAIQVNIGDMLERWTNDQWVSTQHRVLIPSNRDERRKRRQSIAFFQMANYDVVIEPLPTTISVSRPAKYSAITAGDDFMEKTSRQLSKEGEDVVDVRDRASSTSDVDVATRK